MESKIKAQIYLLTFVSVCLLVFSFYSTIFPRQSADAALISEEERRRQASNRRRMLFSLLLSVSLMAQLIVSRVSLVFVLAAPVFAGFAVYYLQGFLIVRRKKRRERKFEDRMLDFLVLVNNNLRSGFALPNAIDIASNSIGGVIESEFNAMMGEYRLGMELSESIRRMQKRIHSENLQLFAAAVCISSRTGSSISLVITRLISTIRKRNDIHDKLIAVTAQFDFEQVMMSLMPFLTFGILYLLDSSMMSPLITTPIGWMIMTGVVVFEIIGFVIMKKLCAIKM